MPRTCKASTAPAPKPTAAAPAERGADSQEIGRSRGGRTTKIHAVADRLGHLIRFELSAGQKADCRAAASLIEALPQAEHLLADTAYDSDDLRKALLDQGTTPVIKPNPHPQAHPTLRCRNLQALQSDRACVRAHQGLAACRHTV